MSQNGRTTEKFKPIKTVADVWENLNLLDLECANKAVDVARIRVRVQINRQRVDLIKTAVRAGVLKGNQLQLTA